jgi:taurine transport system substrate-binding protein
VPNATAQSLSPSFPDASLGTPLLKPVRVGFPRHAIGTWSMRMLDGGFDKAMGRTIDWVPYETDDAVVVAMSAGQLDIGLIGAGVVANAVARGMELQAFSVICGPGDAEMLAFRSDRGMDRGAARTLHGKVIAVPFGSTAHFRVLESLRAWGMSPATTRIANLQLDQIAPAWSRREIDATAAARKLLEGLTPAGAHLPLVTAGEHSSLLLFVAPRAFVSAHLVLLSRFVDLLARTDEAYRSGSSGAADKTVALERIARLSGIPSAQIASAIAAYRPPALAEQASTAWLGGGATAGLALHLKAALDVWRWAGPLGATPPDLTATISPTPVRMALSYRR